MQSQDTENLLRRYKGKLINIKTVSGTVYSGRVSEVTNDYVSLTRGEAENETLTFVLFESMESIIAIEVPSST